MSVRVKTMKRSPKSLKNAGISTEDIGRQFEELIGTDRVDLFYAYPRMLTMVSKLSTFIQCGLTLNEKFFLNDIETYNTFVDFQRDASLMLEEAHKIPIISDADRILRRFKDVDIIAFTKIYNIFKSHKVIKQIMISAGQLQSISSKLKVKDSSFIYRCEGLHFKPLIFCPNFDIFELRCFDDTSSIIKTWVTYLERLHTVGVYFSEELQKPDIDIKKFCETVIQILLVAEKEPGLQGCKAAFEKIRESMHLLEENFSKYYKEFINSEKNSSTIFVSFIKDVTEKNSNAQFGIIAQFTKILNFYTEQMDKSGMKMDPMISKLAAQTRENLASMFPESEADKQKK